MSEIMKVLYYFYTEMITWSLVAILKPSFEVSDGTIAPEYTKNAINTPWLEMRNTLLKGHSSSNNTYKNEKNTTALMHKNFGNGFIGLNSALLAL